MTTIDLAWEMEADDLVRAKEAVQSILRDWDFMSWNELLSDDVVLTLKLGTVGITQVGDSFAFDRTVQAFGRADVRGVLKGIYKELKAVFR